MVFANPLLLAGTALVALPIVLHLIMRRKPRRLEFPAMRFVAQRHDTNQRQLRLRHLLLLLLRAAVIALLATALARPSMKFSGALGSQEAPVAAALVFDTAPRMQYRQENRSRLEAARQFGLWLLAQLPRESQIAVLDTRLGPAVFQVDRGAAVQRIERLETLANSQPLSRAVDEALRLLGRSELARKEVYIFTDLARVAWPADSAARLQDRIADVPGAGIYVIDVGVEEPVNFALGEVRLSAQILAQRSPLEVQTELSCSGPGGKRAVEMYLLDGDRKPQKRSEQACTLRPGESQQLDFRVGGLEVGTHQGFLRIAGEDGLAEDDTRFFTVEVKPPWRILVVAPKPAQSYALFLTEALAPAAFRKQGQARFDCDILSLDQLPQHSLAPYAAVCLLDPAPLEPAIWRKLADFTSEGHGVAIFLGRNAHPVEPLNEPNAQELLPGKLLRQARRPEGDLHLAPRDYQHPILEPFSRQAGSIPWDAFPVFRYWELDKPAAGVTVVIPFDDDRPALLERPLGAGRVLTMTTPVSDRPSQEPWNLLPAGEAWPFVILVNQMMSYLVGGSHQQLNYFAGQTAVLPLEAQSPQRTYLVTTPQDLKFPLAVDQGRNVLMITATDPPGNYRIQAGGEKSGVDRGFSVNLAPEQTHLERLPREKLAELFGPFPFRTARTEDQLDRQISTARVGRELFPALILLVAVVLGLEHVVANRFYREI